MKHLQNFLVVWVKVAAAAALLAATPIFALPRNIVVPGQTEVIPLSDSLRDALTKRSIDIIEPNEFIELCEISKQLTLPLGYEEHYASPAAHAVNALLGKMLSAKFPAKGVVLTMFPKEVGIKKHIADLLHYWQVDRSTPEGELNFVSVVTASQFAEVNKNPKAVDLWMKHQKLLIVPDFSSGTPEDGYDFLRHLLRQAADDHKINLDIYSYEGSTQDLLLLTSLLLEFGLEMPAEFAAKKPATVRFNLIYGLAAEDPAQMRAATMLAQEFSRLRFISNHLRRPRLIVGFIAVSTEHGKITNAPSDLAEAQEFAKKAPWLDDLNNTVAPKSIPFDSTTCEILVEKSELDLWSVKVVAQGSRLGENLLLPVIKINGVVSNFFRHGSQYIAERDMTTNSVDLTLSGELRTGKFVEEKLMIDVDSSARFERYLANAKKLREQMDALVFRIHGEKHITPGPQAAIQPPSPWRRLFWRHLFHKPGPLQPPKHFGRGDACGEAFDQP